ncbi:MAG TPA: replication factor A, partial [Methanosarcinales archaeon]|nr:replication factor A [Methanosarcinales archaeon]
MIKSMANDIKDRFSNIGVDLSADDIESRLDKLITKFKVPKDEARRSVINFYLKENKIQSEDFYKLSAQASEIVSIKDIKEENQWISVKGKIVQLWDALHDSISQVGLIGDETGTIKFTKWKSANLPELVEGKSYLLSNV